MDHSRLVRPCLSSSQQVSQLTPGICSWACSHLMCLGSYSLTSCEWPIVHSQGFFPLSMWRYRYEIRDQVWKMRVILPLDLGAESREELFYIFWTVFLNQSDHQKYLEYISSALLRTISLNCFLILPFRLLKTSQTIIIMVSIYRGLMF